MGIIIFNGVKLTALFQIIGDVFSSILSSNTKDVLLIAEVLDASFDSFADGPCVDQVLASTGLFTAMKNINVMLNSLVYFVFYLHYLLILFFKIFVFLCFLMLY